MPILAPFEAFARDAVALNVEEDESRLPIRWLAAAQVASRLADSRARERQTLLKTWAMHQDDAEADSAGVWTVLSVPGIRITDLESAAATLCHIAVDMERGGAMNLAYSTVTHLRIAMLDRGPVGARGAATLQQARVLRQMGLLEEAADTYEAAQEDALRANDRELEGRAYLGMAVVAGQRGDYPSVRTWGARALELLPANSPYIGNAHNDLMIAAMAANDFASAFDHGWRGYDAVADDAEARATMISNLAFLALRTGRFSAARRGLLAAIGQATTDRISVPALGGLALVSAANRDSAELGRVERLIERASARSNLKYEVARAGFELAQAWQEAGNVEKAAKHLARAQDLAADFGYREIEFRSDLLAEALAAAKAPPAPADDRIEAGVARLDALEVDEGVLVEA